MNIVDKTDAFMPFLKEAIGQKRSDLEISKLVIAKGESMTQIPSNSMDIVVHTFILCSVDDYTAVLSEVHRVLKPGGVCVFIEHSLDNKNGLRWLIQKLIGPVWFCGLDCRFKCMDTIFKSAKYESITHKKFEITHPFFLYLVNPIVYGYGCKT